MGWLDAHHRLALPSLKHPRRFCSHPSLSNKLYERQTVVNEVSSSLWSHSFLIFPIVTGNLQAPDIKQEESIGRDPHSWRPKHIPRSRLQHAHKIGGHRAVLPHKSHNSNSVLISRQRDLRRQQQHNRQTMCKSLWILWTSLLCRRPDMLHRLEQRSTVRKRR